MLQALFSGDPLLGPVALQEKGTTVLMLAGFTCVLLQ